MNARVARMLCLLLYAGAAGAHDLITIEAAERYLADAREWNALIVSSAPAGRRAEAHCRMAAMHDEIRELLNRDIAVHGEPQGVPTNLLIAEMNRAGTPLDYSGRKRRFLPPIAHYQRCLELAPDGRRAGDALSGLLRGHFYESFEDDPLSVRQDWDSLRGQIEWANRYLEAHPGHPDREEIEFIHAILCTRAALGAPDARTRREFASLAFAASNRFESRYPASLRAAAMPLLREALAP